VLGVGLQFCVKRVIVGNTTKWQTDRQTDRQTK